MTEADSKSAERRGTRDPFSTREAMLSWVRDIAPYGLFTTDARLIIRDWNQWLVTHSGFPAEAVIGRSLLDVFPDVAKRRLEEHFNRALRGEVAVLSTALHGYLLPFPAPGRDYPTDHMLQTARIAPLPADDQIIGTITIIEDVTQRECQAATLRRQQGYDRLLSDALASLLRSEDPLHTTAELFPRIAALLKLDVYFNFVYDGEGNELRLQSAGGITPEFRKSIATLPVDGSASGKVVRARAPVVQSHVQECTSAEFVHLRRLGLRSYEAFPLLVGERVLGALAFGSYARDTIPADEVEFLGKVSQYVAIALDRTHREVTLHDAQERLRQHATELEGRVAERTAKLHETIVQLESFSYTIAHDLRAPIRSLNGFTDILLSDFRPQMPNDAQDILERLQRSSRRLDALTRDLLKFSRMIREDVKLAPVNLDELISDTMAVTPALQGEALTVRHPLGTILGQRTLVQQCFSNLFDNALKFATPGQAPRIVLHSEARTEAAPEPVSHGFTPPFHAAVSPVGAEPQTGPRIRIWIEDNGVGIPAQAHHKIWGVFERVPGPVPVEGTGIGLAIVARAMQQMGGACGVESAPGHGSRFWIEFAAA